jgi:multidrug efflux pump subunit AcrB
MALTLMVLGYLSIRKIPIDILPVFKSPAVQTLTFYGGMPAEGVANDITNRMERWVGQASGTKRQESRSIIGASIISNYFQDGVDPNGALTQVNSLALAAVPNLPPGTLPPIVLPFDPTSTTPVCLVAVDSEDPANDESVLYDVGRYEVRNFIMAIPGANAPVVYGGRIRAVMLYIDRNKMQARNLSPLNIMKAMDNYNVFLPTGDAKFGEIDFALDSNSMFRDITHMGDIPLRDEKGNNAAFLRDVAKPADSSFIQTSIVRVNGRRVVYIPVFRQLGTSTLKVVNSVIGSLKDFEGRVSRKNINLKAVMDQSIFVRQAIKGLVQEGVTGGVFCVMVILLFLGQWKMTAIAGMTLPLSILVSITCLLATGNTINVMTLAGMTLALGPMVDSAVICLENTERHLAMGVAPEEAAYLGASQVALPELVSTICTLLVLWPLALTSELGMFLFKPMALAVTFCMIAAYLLSRTLVPACAAAWLKGHGHEHEHEHAGPDGETNGNGNGNGNGGAEAERFQIEEKARRKPRSLGGRLWAGWMNGVDAFFGGYIHILDWMLGRRRTVVGTAVVLLAASLAFIYPILRREFYPDVDSGAFEMTVRAPSGTRIEITERRLAEVEEFLKKTIRPEDLELCLTEIGVIPDWSAAFTPNAGPMDAVVRVQLTAERSRSAQQYVAMLRDGLTSDTRFADLEFAFDAGGMIHAAMNEGKSTPISIRVTGKEQKVTHQIAAAIRERVATIEGVVDARVIQRLNYPEYLINVDRTKAADVGLTQEDVMRNVVAALNSSIQFNKRNFWIDPLNKNQYYVGVQYREDAIKTVETLLNIPVTGPNQSDPVPLRNVASIERTNVPTEVTHLNIQPMMELTMGVAGRDLGHVADEVTRALDAFGKYDSGSTWLPYDPASKTGETLVGSKIVISGEYQKMQDTFSELGSGLALAAVLIYFIMVALDKSWVVPLTVMLTVPFALVGILPMLLLTGTAVNVQSVLGVIFIVGIKVSNTVLMTDYAQELRHDEGLAPTAAIRKAASIRVRPVTMTALAAFFAMVPGALALERGSEANAPLARVILGGLLAGEPATLFVLPMLYSLLVHDKERART